MEVEVTRESSFDRATVNQRASELQARPDHPDAPLWAYHQSLHAAPEQERLKFGFRDGTDWFWHKSGKDGSYRAAGTVDVRWQLSERPDGGQLTATRSGAPFPSGYNIGLMRDQAARMRDLILMVPPGGGEDSLESLERAGTGWRATIKSSDQMHQVDGVWHAGETVLSRVVTLVGDPPEPVGERVSFTGYQRAEDVGRWIAGRVTVAGPDGVYEQMAMVSISPIDPRDMSRMVTLPKVEDSVEFYDFRKPSSDDHAEYAGSTRITWKHEDGQATYDISELELGATSGSVAERPTPGFAKSGLIVAALVGVVVVGACAFFWTRRCAALAHIRPGHAAEGPGSPLSSCSSSAWSSRCSRP